MGVYAPPPYNAINIILKGGYTPPLSYDYETTIIVDGLYAYIPSHYDAIDVVLKSGYTPPIVSSSYDTVLALELDEVVSFPEQFIFSAGNLLSEEIGVFSDISHQNRHVYIAGFLSQSVSEPEIYQRQLINFTYQKIRNTSTATLVIDNSYNPQTNYRSVSLYERGIKTLFSKPTIKNRNQTIANISLYDQLSFGFSDIRLNTKIVSPRPVDSQDFGSASIINRNQRITTNGVDHSIFGSQIVYSLTQYRYLNGFDSSRYGNAYLIGGVKYLNHYGYDSNVFGNLVLTNTTADQAVSPEGIKSPDMLSPVVSPRIIYAIGVNSLSIGVLEIRDPALKPIGEAHTTYGKPIIWFHTRPLTPNSILAYESGYLRVADPTQFILAPSLIESAIFGDTVIKNNSIKIGVTSIGDGYFSDYATLTNSNRYYKTNGISSLAMGAALIANKTPSVFVDSIKPYDMGVPAIGHAIRYVQPSGFDHLLFGRSELTKTPELKAFGRQNSVIGQAWISHKNRDIELSQKGVDSFKAGEQTVWYGQRPLKISSWQSGKYGQPILTHQLRTIESKGLITDAYGSAWISQGSRFLEPAGIYKDFPSNHMVGGTQTIKPVGYEATLWGERIIPVSRSIQPLGFAGEFGNTTVDLYTRYLQPVGYISVGQQPADQWGDAFVYNRLQYIVQEYDVNSGLVPPKWSDYLLLANRNIQMNVTGFSSMRFGYSQIDNNATSLLPGAMEPPSITIGMVSHGIRSIAPEAMEPPPILDWGVVHNAARVIAPLGHTHTQIGNDITVISTRREYRNVGRIDSLETGAPTIGYRIRTIDIERRYSIEPPQINLPIVDLHTRYATFQGVETLRYGTPSLSIHFNIIGPNWDQIEKFGYPALRNVTPELLIYGHDSSEFGRAGVRTQWRDIKAQGNNAAVFGAAIIADTKRAIEVRGFQSLVVGQRHAITQTGTNPYVTQTIWLANINDPEQGNGYGISSDDEFKSNRIPKPGLNQNVLYPNGFHNPKFGTAFIWSNNIQINGGIGTDSVSRGLSVFNKTQSINVSGQGILATVEVGKPRMSPHTIWSVKEAPNQAVTNHNGIRGEHVGAGTGAPTSLRMGKPSIESTIRSIRSSSFVDGKYGAPRLELRLRIIQPEPFNLLRMGMPSIPFTPQAISVRNGIKENNWGEAIVSRPPYVGPQTLKPSGINSFDTGGNAIENFIRFVNASGRDSLSMGGSISGDTPFMWQGLRVGEQVPLIIGGDDMSLHGKTSIGLRVRNIEAQGFNAFSSKYESSSFNDRMKVYNQDKKLPLVQNIEAVGFSESGFGVTGVKYGQQFIRPDGNSDQFRKGGYSG